MQLREVDRRVGELDIVQLHGDESIELVTDLGKHVEIWKAHQVTGPEVIDDLGRWPCDALLDAPSAGRGGSGTTFDWSLAAEAVRRGHRVILAGGLTPDNVAAAIAAVHPYAVDVASGVESAPGIKDPALVSAFIAAAYRAPR